MSAFCAVKRVIVHCGLYRLMFFWYCDGIMDVVFILILPVPGIYACGLHQLHSLCNGVCKDADVLYIYFGGLPVFLFGGENGIYISVRPADVEIVADYVIQGLILLFPWQA